MPAPIDIRNIAIIAHVDHGKTTLVDAMLQQSGVFSEREDVVERVMDSNDQEKERGITIYAKNASIRIGDTKINIVDTPGHADFGSEVERVLKMVDSVLLLVDAFEGPMPQTKFVLRKSLELGLNPILVINKIDKPTARPDAVLDMTFDLFTELGATNEQLDFPHIYTNARDGIAITEPNQEGSTLQPLFDLMLQHIPAAQNDTSAQARFQAVNLSYNDFLGRMALGRVGEGVFTHGQTITLIKRDGSRESHKLTKLMTYEGLTPVEVPEAVAGDVILLAGIPTIDAGDTVAANAKAEALPAIEIDPPTLTMKFLVNDSPFAGREGSLVTSQQIRERLKRELETNVGLQVEFPADSDEFTVSGRGEMHLAVLIESMRREGFELQVGQPRVLFREENGEKQEPYETAVIDVPEELSGAVIEALGTRKGELVAMNTTNGSTRLEYLIPSRGLLGFRTDFLTLTKGEGTLSHVFAQYGPYVGELEKRKTGSMISGVSGKALGFSLNNLQQRGKLFIDPGTEVYEGMVIGTSSKDTMVVNPTKGKQLTNTRAAGSDDAIHLTPPLRMTLERALEYIGPDEYAEITPESVRIRKIHLTEQARKQAGRS